MLGELSGKDKALKLAAVTALGAKGRRRPCPTSSSFLRETRDGPGADARLERAALRSLGNIGAAAKSAADEVGPET